MVRNIIRQNTRILTPALYQKFREGLNPMYKLIADGLLHTGMRVEEFWEFMDHPEWYHPSSRVIDLPRGAIKKIKTLHKERTVMLTKDGCLAIDALLAIDRAAPIRRVTRFAMRDAFRRAAAKTIGVDCINPKMLRKTLVSWLVACEKRDLLISASMGHSLETMKQHYLGLGFDAKDREDMKEFLKGWGEA